MRNVLWLLCLFFSVCVWLAGEQTECSADYIIEDSTVRIGVLAKRGEDYCLSKWQATADYLSKKVEGYTFKIEPLSFEDLAKSVKKQDVDFILANPAFYVELEELFGASRITTLKNLRMGKAYTSFGGVIFCRSDRHDIQDILDLKGKSFMGVAPSSFGGWIMARRVFKDHGIDIEKDFSFVEFGGTHDAVVFAVLNGQVDAGTVRTDTLERMAQEGRIRLDDIRVINQRKVERFPFLLSTRLYPEWPMAKLKQTDEKLAEMVALALLGMDPLSEAAQRAKCAGWTIPLNYHPVRECLRELRIGPYEDLGRVSLGDALRQHMRWVIVMAVVFSGAVVVAFYVSRLNRQLFLSKKALEKAGKELESRVEERTRELAQLNQKLEVEIAWGQHVQEKLAEEKERLAVTLSSIGDGVIATDMSGKITLMNNVAEHLTGWPVSDAQNKDFDEVFDVVDEAGQRKISPLVKVLSTGKMFSLDAPAILRTRNGNQYLIRDIGAPIHDKNSDIIGAVIVFRDVTREKMMEKELVRAQKLESIEVFAGGIAHDFNNIMTAILGYISLARMSLGTNRKVIKQLDEAEEACFRAKNLTQQLLTFAKGAMPVRKVVLIEGIFRKAARVVLVGSGIKADFNFSKDLWPVNVDIGQISQVIQNLVVNSRQAMGNGGIFSMVVSNCHLKDKDGFPLKEGNYVKILVKDTGPGIEPEILHNIFDPYFTTKEGGTGLGLAACYSIVKKHQGHMEVHSEPGKGAQFVIFLPAADKKEIHENHEEGNMISGKGKILVMDDDDMVCDMVGEMLKHLGYEVMLTRDGAEAVNAYRIAQERGRPFDVVLMDLTVPEGMGGAEAVKKILKLDSQAKVIVSSGYSEDPVMSDYADYGFSGVVAKPYGLTELSKAIHTLVNS